MPFDGSDSPHAINRARLIDALRADMPAGFIWDFGEIHVHRPCGAVGCAMGLAYQLGIVTDPFSERMAEALGISDEDADAIFIPDTDECKIIGPHYAGRTYEEVTPAMVADALEKLP